MSHCALCGMQLSGDGSLCLHHQHASEHGWAAVNRVMCDLFHRGIAPARPGTAARDADDREPTAAAA